MKIITLMGKDVELINEPGKLDDDIVKASISLNSTVTWIKFILTDDKPNGNGQRVPKEEFANLKKTAIYMPLKMAIGEIKEDHNDAAPIGVMTHIMEKGDHVEALAALWNKERTEDVAALKERFANGQDIDISWEIHSDRSETNEELKCEDLFECSVNAATIVGIPAYMGRTAVTHMASVKDEMEEENDMGDVNVIELTKHEEIVTGFKETVKVTEKARDDALAAIQELNTELITLRAFKKESDDAKAKVEKMASIREKFAAAGLTLEATYFTEREDKLAAMDDPQIEFLVQELVAFKKTETVEDKEALASITSNLPNLTKKQEEVDTKKIIETLRSLDNKKS